MDLGIHVYEVAPKAGNQSLLFFAPHYHLLSWEQIDEESLGHMVSGLSHPIDYPKITWHLVLFLPLRDRIVCFKNQLFLLWLVDLDMASGDICGSYALQQNINLEMLTCINFLISKLGLLAPRNHLLVLVSSGQWAWLVEMSYGHWLYLYGFATFDIELFHISKSSWMTWLPS